MKGKQKQVDGLVFMNFSFLSTEGEKSPVPRELRVGVILMVYTFCWNSLWQLGQRFV
jgi:hypothetical protein